MCSLIGTQIMLEYGPASCVARRHWVGVRVLGGATAGHRRVQPPARRVMVEGAACVDLGQLVQWIR